MQVLILIVQNTVDFADLGWPPRGDVLPTIGSSFGAAIFGSLFATSLPTDWGLRCPPAVCHGTPPTPRLSCTDFRGKSRRRSSTRTPIR